jgi:prevent-host-death family protein
MNWHLQDAKNSLSRLVRMAQDTGPQVITLRGEPAVVVMSASDYEALTRSRPSLVDMLTADLDWDAELAEDVARRAKLPSRTLEL